MNNEIYVQVNGAERTYTHKDKQIKGLANASCVIKRCDRIAIMGPSGSGKSTLLHVIGGIDTPTKGDITWPALGEGDRLRPDFAGIVFQMQSLIPSMNILENVVLPLLIMGNEKVDAFIRAQSILEKFELEELSLKLPEELSGGQMQRAALARALVTNPKLLLADEPTGQLDHPTAQHLFTILLDYLKGTDTALVVATHDKVISELMDKVWKINHGVLEADNVI